MNQNGKSDWRLKETEAPNNRIKELINNLETIRNTVVTAINQITSIEER